jgi:ABC-type amino acid transport substrate-binding protein
MIYLQEADGAAADLTITSERLQVVDFTQPYLQSSLQMVVPIKSKDNLGIGILSSPFSPDLWLAIGVTFVATIVSLAIVEPFDPPAEIERFHWRQRLVKSLW